jgi:NADP-dependent 3-hydroxy acid dehydrogenase YdfG
VAADIRTAALQRARRAPAARARRTRVHDRPRRRRPGAGAQRHRSALERMGRLDVLVNNAGTDVTLPIDELTKKTGCASSAPT